MRVGHRAVFMFPLALLKGELERNRFLCESLSDLLHVSKKKEKVGGVIVVINGHGIPRGRRKGRATTCWNIKKNSTR